MEQTNKVIFQGKVCKNPTQVTFKSGKVVTNANLVNITKCANRDKVNTTYIKIEAWDEMADVLKSVSLGDELLVEAFLKSKDCIDESGNKYNTHSLVITSLKLL